MNDVQGTSFVALGVDVGAMLAVVATMEHLVPTILGILGGIWYCIEIYDCPRMVRWRERRAARKANKNTIADATQQATLSVAKATADATADRITAASDKTVAELKGEPSGTGPGNSEAPSGSGSPAPGTIRLDIPAKSV